MTKLSIVLKQDEVLNRLCRMSPAVWLKLRRSSRLFMWRLDDTRLHALQQQLIDELHLVFVDLHELCERGEAECVWLLISQGMSVKLRDGGSDTIAEGHSQWEDPYPQASRGKEWELECKRSVWIHAIARGLLYWTSRGLLVYADHESKRRRLE